MSDFPALDNLCIKITKELQAELQKHNSKWAVDWRRSEWDAQFRCSLGLFSKLSPSVDLVYASMLLESRDLAVHIAEQMLSIWMKENDDYRSPVTADKVDTPRKASRGPIRHRGKGRKRK